MSDLIEINPSVLSKIKQVKLSYWHYAEITRLLLLSDGRVASSSIDKTIRIYNISKNTYEFDLKGHSERINDIVQNWDGQIISCSNDLSLAFWEINKKPRRNYIINKAHERAINKIDVTNDKKLLTCSCDGIVKIWKGQAPYNLIKFIKITEDALSHVKQINEKILLASSKSNFYIWNEKVYQLMLIIKNVFLNDTNILHIFKEKKLLLSGRNSIGILNYEKLIIESIITDKRLGPIINAKEYKNNIILAGCSGGQFVIYNYQKNTYFVKDVYISFLFMSSLIFMSGKELLIGTTKGDIILWKLEI